MLRPVWEGLVRGHDVVGEPVRPNSGGAVAGEREVYWVPRSGRNNVLSGSGRIRAVTGESTTWIAVLRR